MSNEYSSDCVTSNIISRLQRLEVPTSSPGPMAQAFTSRAFGAWKLSFDTASVAPDYRISRPWRIVESLAATYQSIPDVSFVVVNAVALEKFSVLVLKRDPLMMDLLPGDVALHS